MNQSKCAEINTEITLRDAIKEIQTIQEVVRYMKHDLDVIRKILKVAITLIPVSIADLEQRGALCRDILNRLEEAL